MSRFRFYGPTSGLATCLIACTFLALGFLVSISSAAEKSSLHPGDPEGWIENMQAYFDAHPELKNKSGTGWNPFQRYKWFIEPRISDGQPIPAQARWNAWLQRKSMRVEAKTAAVDTWFTLGPSNFAGRMLAMDFDPIDPSIVWTGGADGGVWKSTDSGGSWTPMSDELPSLAIGALAVNKTDRDNICIGTGEPTPNVDRVGGVGILRSTDGGSTWVTTSYTNGPGGSDGFHFMLSTTAGTFLAGNDDGLWRSSDKGATWVQKRNTGQSWYDGCISPLNGTMIFAVRGNAGINGAGIRVSTNDGVNWSFAGSGQPTSISIGPAQLSASGQTIYCFIGAQGFGADPTWGLTKSTDNGATWVTQSATGKPSGQAWYNLSCAADPDNTSRVICGAQPFARSNNGGSSFSTLSGPHVDHHMAMYEPGSGSNVWVATDGGMWRSTDDGSSWVDKNNGLITYQFYDICVNGDPTRAYYVIGGTQDNGTDKWQGTTVWSDEIGGDGFVCNICEASGNYAYGELYYGYHYKSTNGAAGNPTFSSFDSGLPAGSGQWVTPVALDANDPIHLLTEMSGNIYRSTNGSSWSLVGSGLGATWLDISRVDGDVAWAIQGTTARVTTDNGNTWNSYSTGAGSGGTKILADPADANTAWATFSTYSGSNPKVMRTTDVGVTWTDQTGDLPGMPVNAIAIDPSNPTDIYIGTDVGVWMSTNAGTNWLPIGDGSLPNAVVSDLEISDFYRKIVAGTHGRGAWELTIPAGGAVSAQIDVPQESRNLMLDPASPNPARDRTLLRYAARSDAPVSLEIYDVQGRLVRHLEDFSRGDGLIRTTPWHTDGVPTGVYFAVLRAGNVEKTQKITVIK